MTSVGLTCWIICLVVGYQPGSCSKLYLALFCCTEGRGRKPSEEAGRAVGSKQTKQRPLYEKECMDRRESADVPEVSATQNISDETERRRKQDGSTQVVRGAVKRV